GRGIRIVRSEDELADGLERTQVEALRTFGDATIFMEKLVEGGRHIEVQVIADQHGAVWAPGVRDCSVQRRNQKLIEESSSPALSPEQDASLRESAKALVKAASYVNAGTVEFLYQPTEKLFTFLEVNTRLQVEHPVTEATTGLDIVKLQLHVADGGRLEGDPPSEFGHAVEARLNAEDADQEFAPAPGTVEFMRLPTGPGMRVDTGITVGDVIPPAYDSMVAKIIAWGRDRPEALARLRVALRETTVVLRGGTTTKSFLLALLDRPEVVAGTADTGWLDRTGVGGGADPERHAAIALVQVALDVSDAEEGLERVAFLSSARGGRPRVSHDVERTVELGYRGQVYRLTVAKVDPGRYRVSLDDRHVDVAVDRLSALESRLTIGDERFSVVASHAATSHLVEVDGVTHRITRDEEGVVRAPAPAVVVAVRAGDGEDVEAGQTIVVLESMKMETVVRAPYSGRIREVLAVVNSQVDAGAALLRLDPAGDDDEKVVGERVTLPGSKGAPAGMDRTTALDVLATMQALITGYDVSAEHGRQLVSAYSTARSELPVDDPELLHGELALLTTFADLSELSRNRPTSAEEQGDEQVHSPREHFHSYLHSLDIDREALPESFRARLSRALLHYGVGGPEAGPALEEAVFRIFLAQQRTADQLPVVLALLDRWLTAGQLPAGPLREGVAEVLDRLIVATQLRYPSVGDVARAVRFRYFEKPLVEQARQEVVDRAERLLAELADSPGGAANSPQDMERVQALVDSPEPLIRLLAQRLSSPTPEPDPVLEVLTRRYYRRRSLENLRSFLLDGRTCVTGDYELNGERLHLVALMAQHESLPAALSSLARLVAESDDPSNVVVDLYLSWPDRPSEAGEMADRLREQLTESEVLRSGRRVTVTVSTPSGDVETLTFRPSPEGDGSGPGLAEDEVIRGMHPLTAQRLDLWRLKNFNGRRLPSAEDTYLFHVVATENPNDERLFAMAEVRDATPLRDAAGEVIGFPTVERLLTACIDSLRRARAQLGGGRRLDHNRIFLYAWPSIELPLTQLATLARAIAPLTVGAGVDEIVILGRLQEEPGVAPRDVALRFSNSPGTGVGLRVTDRPTEPMRPLDDYTQKVLRSRARGLAYPYELAPLLAGPGGTFVEHDLDADGRLVPVDRPPGTNRAGIVAGLVTTPTERYPEGITRVALFGDPTKALGTVAEPECAIVI
ncbi:MAG TPA: biotin/lipoyl-containing protein, partial [Blastococcus sp.]